MSKIDEDDFKCGKKVVELLQRQFANKALTTHKYLDVIGYVGQSASIPSRLLLR